MDHKFCQQFTGLIYIVYRIYLDNSPCFNNSPSPGTVMAMFCMIFDNIYNDIIQ